jgi:hypothetical protein
MLLAIDNPAASSAAPFHYLPDDNLSIEFTKSPFMPVRALCDCKAAILVLTDTMVVSFT